MTRLNKQGEGINMMKLKSLVLGLVSLLVLFPVVPASANADCYNPRPFTDLSRCNFVGLDLSNYDLSYSNLYGANLTNTNLTGANLTSVRAEKIVGKPRGLPKDWVQIDRLLLGPGANLSGMNLSNLNLTNLNLTGVDLSSALMTQVNLTNVNLTDATLTDVYGNSIVGTPRAMPEEWVVDKGYIFGPTANLSSLTLTDIDFRKYNISSASLSAANLIRANLSGMDMQGVTLNAAGLVDTNITDTNFSEMNLQDLRTSGLIGKPRALPAGWVLRRGFLFGPGANLSSADLRNFDFKDIDLSGVNLAAANLANSDLSGVNLTQTNIAGANLSSANITDANLAGVDLTGLITADLIGEPVGLDESWKLFNGYLVGPTANLSTTNWSGLDLRSLNLTGVNFVSGNLSGANLAGVDLTGINLTGVNLAGANLTETILTDAILDQVIARDLIGEPIDVPAPWQYLRGFLLGPTANLNGADLKGFDLREADLTGASLLLTEFNNADLRDATLTGAAMEGANLTGAKLLGVISGNIIGTPIGLPSNFIFVSGTIKVILFLTPTPKITGLAKVGSKLTAVAGTWDEGIELTYQWERNGEPISDATENTYKLVVGDYKKGVSVTVTGTGTGGAAKSMKSVDKPIAPGTMSVKAPKITGSIAKGKTVKANVLAWVKGAKIKYTWLLNGKPIKGATKNSYKILPKQVGKKLSLLVKQTAAGYSPAGKASKASKIK
ncbi:MAG: pentapeptide repeat-containing protein [Micrococcales bacterium]|nr:pentapeptide repeat-containing protein [Actinomycetota bacterium]NCA07916.1 pentapeptide repeat-containing protein [Micrococcales bacterium]